MEWTNDYDYLQIDRFAKLGEGSYTIRNRNKTPCSKRMPQTNPF